MRFFVLSCFITSVFLTHGNARTPKLSFEDKLKYPKTLEAIDLSGMNLSPSMVTKAIKRYPNLIELDLSSNKLKSLPPEIGNLPLLERLYLNNNLLTALPNEIEKLRNLKIIYLDENNFSDKEIARIRMMLSKKIHKGPAPVVHVGEQYE